MAFNYWIYSDVNFISLISLMLLAIYKLTLTPSTGYETVCVLASYKAISICVYYLCSYTHMYIAIPNSINKNQSKLHK